MANRHTKVIQAGILSLAFFLLVYGPVNDPDFGWHLSSGMYYLDHWSVPSHDIFSWTAPDYPWINHEYAADATYALLYRIGHHTTVLLSLLFTAIAAYLFLSILPRLCVRRPDWKQRFLIGFPALLMAKPFFGVRSQVFDWLAVALILLIWQKYETDGKNKILWTFPILFLVWANIHAGFPLGLLMLASLMFFHLAKTMPVSALSSPDEILSHFFRQHRKITLVFWGVLTSALLATFFTAYHYHLYADLIRFSHDKEPLQYIIEWAPSAIGTSSALPFFCYLFLLIFLLFDAQGKQKILMRDALLFIVFLFCALSYVRFIPLFAIVSLPVVYRRFADHQLMPEMLAFVVLAAFIAGQASLFGSAPPSNNQPTTHTAFVSSPLDIRQKAFYANTPIDAFTWLKTQKLPPRMFNTYDWGGEIIWQMPNVPVFIDGRANNRRLFHDYIAIERVTPKWYETIQRYDIRWFFIRQDSSLAAALNQLPDTWEKKYQDGQAVVFMRKK